MTCSQDDMLTTWHVHMLTTWHVDKITCSGVHMLTTWHVDIMTCWHYDMLTRSHDKRLRCFKFETLLTHSLTRVKPRDASASKNMSSMWAQSNLPVTSKDSLPKMTKRIFMIRWEARMCHFSSFEEEEKAENNWQPIQNSSSTKGTFQIGSKVWLKNSHHIVIFSSKRLRDTLNLKH